MSKKITNENGKINVKKRILKKWWLGLIVLLIAGGCSASSSDEPTVAEDSSEQTESSTKTSSSEEMKTEFKVGQTISYNGVNMKADEVKYINPSEYDSLGDNEQFVAVKMTIKNVKDDKPVDYNPYDFKLSADGNQTDFSEYMSDQDSITNNELSSGSLEKGASVTGWLVGKAKKDVKKLQLQYTGNLFDNESKIDINLK